MPPGLEFARNSIVSFSDAVVAIGGGAGTLSEICFAWIYKRIIVALGKEEWASHLADQKLDHRIRYKEISDDRIYGADKPEQAIDLQRSLMPFYRKSHRPKE